VALDLRITVYDLDLGQSLFAENRCQKQQFEARNQPAQVDAFKFLESLSENSEGCCFRAKGRMARRDEGEYPWWIFD
jgi:hypothetical protein